MTKPIRLAIADDHAMFRRGVLAVVSRLNVCIVVEASNGRELLDKIAALDKPPEVCILDIHMPVLTGPATLREVKQRWPEIKVLILSMLDSEATARNMLNEGAAGYLLKDGPAEELEKAILAIIEEGIYESQFSKKAVKKETEGLAGSTVEITECEKMFLRWCCCDLSYGDIALRMGLKAKAIEAYATNLSLKFDVKTRVGLMQSAIKLGLEPAE